MEPISSTSVPPIQENLPPTPIQPVPPTQTVGFPEPKKTKGFSIFVGASVVVLLIVWGLVAYLYFDNQKLSNTSGISEISVSPTPSFLASNVRVSNGNIIYESGFEEPKILVDKTNHPETGIIGFYKVLVSPNNENMCFESISPATLPALYISKTDGTGVTKVSDYKTSCIWSTDSNALYYVSTPRGETKASDIYSYTLETGLEVNLTENLNTEGDKQYSLTQSGNDFLCTFNKVTNTNTITESGTCTLNVSENTITENTTSGQE